ncbi:MAG: hypothetical protein QW453_07065 [Thermoprotei archaeon]
MSRLSRLALLLTLLAIATISTLAVQGSPANKPPKHPILVGDNQPSFQSTFNLIIQAYNATYTAARAGANTSTLTAKLNEALSYYQAAQAANKTNPTIALQELANSSKIASQVVSEAASATLQAHTEAHTKLIVAGLESAATVAAGVLVYLYGEQLYLTLWYHAYRGYTVKRRG